MYIWEVTSAAGRWQAYVLTHKPTLASLGEVAASIPSSVPDITKAVYIGEAKAMPTDVAAVHAANIGKEHDPEDEPGDDMGPGVEGCHG